MSCSTDVASAVDVTSLCALQAPRRRGISARGYSGYGAAAASRQKQPYIAVLEAHSKVVEK
jgi:hypothetical protein